MSKTQYKVGDKVEVIKEADAERWHAFSKGNQGVITDIDCDGDLGIDVPHSPYGGTYQVLPVSHVKKV